MLSRFSSSVGFLAYNYTIVHNAHTILVNSLFAIWLSRVIVEAFTTIAKRYHSCKGKIE